MNLSSLALLLIDVAHIPWVLEKELRCIQNQFSALPVDCCVPSHSPLHTSWLLCDVPINLPLYLWMHLSGNIRIFLLKTHSLLISPYNLQFQCYCIFCNECRNARMCAGCWIFVGCVFRDDFIHKLGVIIVCFIQHE